MKWLKVGAVVFCAVLLTALGIDAADTLSGSRSTLLGQLISATPTGKCPSGMVEVPAGVSFGCVDKYEASPSKECPHSNPQNALETQENMNDPECKAASEKEQNVWTFISREQAVAACLRGGKRLPKNSEWYVVSAGTHDAENKCNMSGGGAHKTGKGEECVSAVGAVDTVGNVWEWVSDDVIEGKLSGRELPATGYVAQVDSEGIATLTSQEPSDLFSQDYFWSQLTGAFGMIRGGFYGSKSDAGVYAIHADTLPTTSGTAIGFRCVL
jgi:hypothetical protein